MTTNTGTSSKLKYLDSPTSSSRLSLPSSSRLNGSARAEMSGRRELASGALGGGGGGSAMAEALAGGGVAEGRAGAGFGAGWAGLAAAAGAGLAG